MKNINHSNSRYANILADIEKKAAEHCKTIGRYDESLFNIGIELGKLLQSNNIQEQRLQIFTNFDKSNAEYTKKHAYVKRIENIIGCFVANAFAQQIENNGAFTFSRPNFMHKCEKLEESISSEFFMQIISTKQKENGGSRCNKDAQKQNPQDHAQCGMRPNEPSVAYVPRTNIISRIEIFVATKRST
jgi:hypothetical protein